MLASTQEHLKILIGFFRKEEVAELKKLTKLSYDHCCKIISKFCSLLREQFHDQIWNPRCEKIIAMEKVLGISRKDKKAKSKGSDNQDSLEHSRVKISRGSSHKNLKKLNTSFSPKVWNKIEGWVFYGKKWLGI